MLSFAVRSRSQLVRWRGDSLRLTSRSKGSRLVLFPRSRAAPPDEDLMSDIELIHVPTERRESAYGRDPGLRISFPPAENSPICGSSFAYSAVYFASMLTTPDLCSACVGEGAVYTLSERIGAGLCRCMTYVDNIMRSMYVGFSFGSSRVTVLPSFFNRPSTGPPNDFVPRSVSQDDYIEETTKDDGREVGRALIVDVSCLERVQSMRAHRLRFGRPKLSCHVGRPTSYRSPRGRHTSAFLVVLS